MSSNQTYNPLIGGKEEAIKNLGGMVWLYEKHLIKFRNTYADSAAVTREYLLRGNTGDAQILIHSIKGLAGTLGLRQLYYAAADLEQAIKQSDSSTDMFLDIYEAHLCEALKDTEKD